MNLVPSGAMPTGVKMQFALAWGRGLTVHARPEQREQTDCFLTAYLMQITPIKLPGAGLYSLERASCSPILCALTAAPAMRCSVLAHDSPCTPSLLRLWGWASWDRQGQSDLGENLLKAGVSTAREELDGSSTLRSSPLLPVHPVLPVQGLQQASCQHGVASDDALGANQGYHFQRVHLVFSQSSMSARYPAAKAAPGDTHGAAPVLVVGASWRWQSRGWH